jgi:hypothetical protein
MGKTGCYLLWKATDHAGLHDNLFIFRLDNLRKGVEFSNCIEPFHAAISGINRSRHSQRDYDGCEHTFQYMERT